jgi:hypothetical protein
LINIPAFLFLNDFDNYTGLFFKKHLKVHYSEITIGKKEEFLLFKYTEFDYQAWLLWVKLILSLYINQAVAGYFTK